ncbi:hypothetical protein EIO_3272 (plasmid) [Ketogulonicigenium vulgare Y25]|nr:hypothetical protein EIO_3272 [Ketogulonicigenium vulgare Y25]
MDHALMESRSGLIVQGDPTVGRQPCPPAMSNGARHWT